jgi:hypothetical protein
MYVGSVMKRWEAIEQGLKVYESDRPCKRGHGLQRYTSNGCCLGCLASGRADRNRALIANAQGWPAFTVRAPQDRGWLLHYVAAVAGTPARVAEWATLEATVRGLMAAFPARPDGALVHVSVGSTSTPSDEQGPDPDPDWITTPVEPAAPPALPALVPLPRAMGSGEAPALADLIRGGMRDAS